MEARSLRNPLATLFPRSSPPLRGALAAAALLFVLPAAAAAQEDDLGYRREYVIQADAAWIAPGRVLSPAFVGVDRGRIRWVAPENLAANRPAGPLGLGGKPPRVIRVHGTLAPSMVDAWCEVRPSDLQGDRRATPVREVADSLPAQRPFEDPALAAAVAAAREAGFGAMWVSPGGRALRTGVGVACTFGAHDLPAAAGSTGLDFVVGVSVLGASGSYAVEDLADAFDEAEGWLDEWDDYQEKLEKYEKDLEKYREKLAKWKEEKAKHEEAAAAGDAGDGDGQGKGKAKEEGAPEPPKRPQRPLPPKRELARDQLLAALRGEHLVRVRADDVADLRAVIALREEYGLDLVVLGGRWADEVADELAAAEIPVVLSLRDAEGDDFPERSLAARFRRLRAAGVEVALASGGGQADQAAALLRAGSLVADGADPDEVWAALTVVPARILGLGERHGRIAPGASASLLLFEGSSPFDLSAPFRSHKPR